ncbi:MAG: hypothetical protein JWM80_6476 [Cyanobacteria bacterium RYN_339]|nr:hypothetical protein [Cyanobacteria bacterium RYN_339]
MRSRPQLTLPLVLASLLVLPGNAARAGTSRLPITVGMMESVQGAITRATPGDVIEVHGPHVEQVALKSGITLRGRDGGSLNWSNGTVIRGVGIENVVIEDLSIIAPGDAIELVDAKATVRGCKFWTNGTAVQVGGSSDVAIAGVKVQGGGQIGIRFAGHAHGSVTGSEVVGCILHGIAIVDDAAPTLRQNVLQKNHFAGIAYFGRGRGTAEDNLCRENGKFGVLLVHQAAPTLRHNTILGNAEAGISSSTTGAANVIGNLIAQNGSGVIATPPLQGLEQDATANLVAWNSGQPGAGSADLPHFLAGTNAFVLARDDGMVDDRYGWHGPPAGGLLAERPKAPPLLKAVAAFKDASGNGVLEADEAASIELTIQNVGQGKATQLRAACEAGGVSAGLSVPLVVAIGDLAPGETRKAIVPVKGRTDLVEGKATVQIALEDAFGFDAPLMKTTFATHRFAQPALAIRGPSIEDANGNGVVERGEQLDLRVQVVNGGAGLAHQVVAKLQLGDARIKPTGDETIELGDLSPGASKEARFSILVVNRYDGPQQLPIKIVVSEAHPEFGVTAPIQVTLDRAAPTSVDRVVEATAPSVAPAPEEDDLAIKGPAAAPNPNAFAVVIGIERYNGQLPEATYARRDAAAFRGFCERALGVPRENAIVLTDEQATGGNIRTALEGQLARWVEKDKSDLYVYFAGHGAPDAATKSAFLVPFDGNPSYPSTSCYSLATAYDALARLHARSVTVMLDSCFSGQSNRTDQARPLVANLRPLFIETNAEAVPAGLTVFAAAAGSQTSTGYAAKHHGLFTYFMLKGLQGEADANHDHQVTVGELKAYVTGNVAREARRANQEQTPMVSGNDERVLVTLP